MDAATGIAGDDQLAFDGRAWRNERLGSLASPLDAQAEIGFELPMAIAGEPRTFRPQHHRCPFTAFAAQGRVSIVLEHRDINEVELRPMLTQPTRERLHISPSAPEAGLRIRQSHHSHAVVLDLGRPVGLPTGRENGGARTAGLQAAGQPRGQQLGPADERPEPPRDQHDSR